MRRVVVVILILSLLAIPQSSRAENNGDGTPSWVPWTVAGMMVLGGVLYLNKQIRGDHAAERKTPKQSAIGLIAYVATPGERAELDSLESKADVQGFLTRFFIARDPTPETPENEFRDELVKRFRYANLNLGDHGEGWRSDAGRVHILYGPAETVLRAPMLEPQSPPGLPWKYAEFWEYARGTGGNPVPVILQDPILFDETFHSPLPSRGRMLFVFARKTEGGRLVQVYSTEPGEVIDPELLRPAAGGSR